MPRRKRIWKLGHCHHVMFRGIGGQAIFEDKHDLVKFCLFLQYASELYFQKIHGFCLMLNHIHLIIEPTKGDLKDGMHNVAFRYAQYFNLRYNRKGYLFQGRFRSIMVENSSVYLQRLIRYIHLNPVEAGLVKRPEEYLWCSHRAYLGCDVIAWLETSHVLKQFGDTLDEARGNFSMYVDQQVEADSDRKEINTCKKRGVFGSVQFMQNHNSIRDIEKDKEIQKFINLPCEEIIQRVSDHFNISLEKLRGSGKNSVEVAARAIIARACQLSMECSLGDVSRILGKHHGTVSKLASKAALNPILTEKMEMLFREDW